MTEIPKFITHYNRSEPFRSMTSLSQEEQANSLRNLNESNSWGLGRFQDPEYLVRRSVVEKTLRETLMNLGGRPELLNPIYFFLGRSESFEQHPANRAYQIDIKDLSELAVSFTYGDSLLAFDEEYKKQVGGKYQSTLCGRIFLLSELEELFSHPEYHRELPLHIEVQLWLRPSEKIVKRV